MSLVVAGPAGATGWLPPLSQENRGCVKSQGTLHARLSAVRLLAATGVCGGSLRHRKKRLQAAEQKPRHDLVRLRAQKSNAESSTRDEEVMFKLKQSLKEMYLKRGREGMNAVELGTWYDENPGCKEYLAKSGKLRQLVERNPGQVELHTTAYNVVSLNRADLTKLKFKWADRAKLFTRSRLESSQSVEDIDDAEVLSSLSQKLEELGGSMGPLDLGEWYDQHRIYKAYIRKQGGLQALCDRSDGLLVGAPQPLPPGVPLLSLLKELASEQEAENSDQLEESSPRPELAQETAAKAKEAELWKLYYIYAVVDGQSVDMSVASDQMAADPDLEGFRERDMNSFAELLPDGARSTFQSHPQRRWLTDVVLHVGRKPTLLFTLEDGVKVQEFCQRTGELNRAALEETLQRLPSFNSQGRCTPQGQLHRISSIRNSDGRVKGLTMRVGRPAPGCSAPLEDLLTSELSILLIGPPGRGKTTLLRDIASKLSKKRHVVLVDKSSEIAGSGDVPHWSVGDAVQLQLPSNLPTDEGQKKVLLEALENHSPHVIIADELSNLGQAKAALTISTRGVRLVGTCHGSSLREVYNNKELRPLIGQFDRAARSDDVVAMGGQKIQTYQVAPGAFDIAIVLESKTAWTVHSCIGKSMDALLDGKMMRVEKRKVDDDGQFLKRSEAVSD